MLAAELAVVPRTATLHSVGAAERATLLLAARPPSAAERRIFISSTTGVLTVEITVSLIRVGALALSNKGAVSIAVVRALLSKDCTVLRDGFSLMRSFETLRDLFLLGLRTWFLLLAGAARQAFAHRALRLGKPRRNHEPGAALRALRHALLGRVIFVRFAARHRSARLEGGLLRLQDLVLEQRDQVHVLFFLRPRA